MTRHASCNCGQLQLVCSGEPVRVAMCHCLECQKRTGSTFSVHAWFQRSAIEVRGEATAFLRVAESGNPITFHFCPTCGATVYWELKDLIAVAVGSFADPEFPLPHRAVWERRRHHWLDDLAALPMEHSS